MTEKAVISYTDCREYKKALKARSAWTKTNDYKVFDYALCLECRHYRPDPCLPIHGNCELMKQEGGISWGYGRGCLRQICKRSWNWP
jgi:hypothetical protein